jgi:hypothetical protein
MKIEFSVLLFTFTYSHSLSQKIVKSHVSNYLKHQENKHKIYLQLITIRFQKLKTIFSNIDFS